MVNGSRAVYYRGARVLKAQMEELVARWGLLNASDVVYSGCSAGGLSALLHADKWRALLPPTAKFASLPESGFFLDFNSSTPGAQEYSALMRWVVSGMNGTAHLPAACVAAHPEDPGLCVFAEHLAPTLVSPTFVLNSKYDYVQVPWILDSKDPSVINAWGELFSSRLHNNLLAANSAHGAFVDSCWRHCWYGGGWSPASAGIHINGTQTAVAFAQWYASIGSGAPQAVYEQCHNCYPCKDCCS